MRFVDWGLAILGAALVCCPVADLACAESVGMAASVVPSADFTRGTVVRTLTINEALEQDDRIRTSEGGSIQVRFLDDTLLTIGPNSEILLDKFVFDGSTAKNLSIEVVRGAMRFVSGTSDHAAYEIKTPVATIGVRGTIVDTGYVNDHWIHNTIDGAITGCVRGTSNCRNYNAGEPAFSVGPSGFISINPSETTQLFRSLDQTHFSLAHAAGKDPSAPSGAAAGSGGTGSTGGGTGGTGTGGTGTGGTGTGGTGTGGTGTGGTGTGSEVLGSGLGGCSSCAPPPPPPPCTTAACLGVVTSVSGSGPAFPSFMNVIRVTGAGGDNVIPPNSVINDNSNIRKSNYIFAPLSTVTWDNATDLRKITLQGTSDPLDPNKLTLTRGTAQITDVTVGTGNVPTLGVVPVYYMASISNGTVLFSDTNAGSGTATFPANQSLQLLGWGYTGDLFGTRNSFPTVNTVGNTTSFGTVVLFDLERATTPTWNRPIGANPTTSPPGTFVSGQVAVGIGPTALYYGMTGIVNMPGFGLFNFSTNGGTADPRQSGVMGPLIGDYGRLQNNSFNTVVTPTGAGAISFCGVSCNASLQFDDIFLQKIGVTYNIAATQSFNHGDPQIQGIATFAQNSSTPITSPSPTAIVSFVDPISSPLVAATNPASGVVENIANGVALKQANLASGEMRIRGTAAVVDMGSVPGIISWERWTNGTFTQNGSPIAIPQDAGVSFVYGTPVTYVSFGNPSPPASFGPSVQFSLIGATTPTISDGSVSTSIANHAFVGSGGNTTSKLGVDFTNMKVGLDMYVQIGAGFGQSIYNFATPGGAANPSSSGITIDSGGQFSTGGRTLPVSFIGTPGGGVSSCSGLGVCKAGVTGFLSGSDATYAGLNYYFGNTTSTVPLVSGAAVFGRDMPITEAAAYAFAYGPTQSFSQGVVGGANAQVIGGTNLIDTPTGLALQNFFINNNSFGANFFRDTAIVKEQGTLGGGFSGTGSAIGGILGWERWTSGTVTTCTANPCDGSVPANLVSRNLTAGQGLHIVQGIPATNLPTSGNYNYVLAGATSPTTANGLVSPGTLHSNSTMSVQFGATPGVSANLNVGINSENYNVQTTTPMPLNNVKFDSGGFAIPVNAGILCPAPCKGSIGGFLAGPGAMGLGIFYQIGNASAPATTISGAAGFKKQ